MDKYSLSYMMADHKEGIDPVVIYTVYARKPLEKSKGTADIKFEFKMSYCFVEDLSFHEIAKLIFEETQKSLGLVVYGFIALSC